MKHAITKNMVGGVLFFLFGTFFAGYALVYLKLGAFARMGPGLFPTVIGAILAGIGALMLAAEIVRARDAASTSERYGWERIEWRSLAAIVAAMAVFSLMVARFGVIPGIFAIVFVASLASDEPRPLSMTALSVGLSVAAYLIFVRLLGLPFPLFDCPF